MEQTALSYQRPFDTYFGDKHYMPHLTSLHSALVCFVVLVQNCGYINQIRDEALKVSSSIYFYCMCFIGHKSRSLSLSFRLFWEIFWTGWQSVSGITYTQCAATQFRGYTLQSLHFKSTCYIKGWGSKQAIFKLALEGHTSCQPHLCQLQHAKKIRLAGTIKWGCFCQKCSCKMPPSHQTKHT